jgi:hypothetical protein
MAHRRSRFGVRTWIDLASDVNSCRLMATGDRRRVDDKPLDATTVIAWHRQCDIADVSSSRECGHVDVEAGVVGAASGR